MGIAAREVQLNYKDHARYQSAITAGAHLLLFLLITWLNTRDLKWPVSKEDTKRIFKSIDKCRRIM